MSANVGVPAGAHAAQLDLGQAGTAYGTVSGPPRVVAERSTTYALPANSYPGATYAAPMQGGIEIVSGMQQGATYSTQAGVGTSPVTYAAQGMGTYATPTAGTYGGVTYASTANTYAAAVPTYAAPTAGYVSAGQVAYAQPMASVNGQAVYSQPVQATAAYQPPPAGYVPSGGSFVPPPAPLPCTVASAQGPPQPVQPQSLTAGLPDPGSIETQKAAYNKSLEEQAKHGEDMLRMQRQQQTDHIYQAAEAQKRQLISQIDQQAKAQELQLSQKYSQQVMNLQQEFHHQKLVLEKQANDLTLEYRQRKAQEELMTQQYEMQRQHYEDHMKVYSEAQQAVVQHQTMSGATQQAAWQHAQQMQQLQQMQSQAMGQIPHMTTGGGSYVPPPANMVPGHGGSYVPPPAPVVNAGSYVPPPEVIQASAVPGGGCSYTLPQTAGYSAPQTVAQYPSSFAAVTAPDAAYAAQYPSAPTQYGGAATQYGVSPPTQYGATYSVAPTNANMYGGGTMPPYETVPPTNAQTYG